MHRDLSDCGSLRIFGVKRSYGFNASTRPVVGMGRCAAHLHPRNRGPQAIATTLHANLIVRDPIARYNAMDHALSELGLAVAALCHAQGALSRNDCCAVRFFREAGCAVTGGASCIVGLLHRRG